MLLVLRSAAEQGFIYSLVALALYLSYRTLDIADLTTDGTFTLGCAISATMTLAGHPLLGLVLAIAAGAAAGGRPYSRARGRAATRPSASANPVRTSSAPVRKNGNSAGSAVCAASDSPSRTPSAHAAGQRKNAANSASDKNSFMVSPRQFRI